MGAAGVILGALSAHAPGAANLSVASSFLLFHAVAVLALGSASVGSHVTTAAMLLLLSGAALFSGTLALDNLAGIKIKPSPAPFGGTLLIIGWLIAAISFVVAGREDRP